MELKAISQSKWASLLILLVILIALVPMQSHHPHNAVSQQNRQEQPHSSLGNSVQGMAPSSAINVPETEAVMVNLTTQSWIDKAKASPFLDEDRLAQLATVEVTATGYYAGKESTGKDSSHPEYGITYSGVKVKRAGYSTIAADTSVFPLGTILWIPGYGYGVVADIGSAIKGMKIDLYFATKDQVYKEWGKKKVHVRIIAMGQGEVTEEMLEQLNHPVLTTKS